mmetsp:Transcript_25756/g.79230  ORF Transcript_25756/g.79230 Transcript_25756/m.79230 type:complete len:410 (+) Transcript_25756:632-1861(+)
MRRRLQRSSVGRPLRQRQHVFPGRTPRRLPPPRSRPPPLASPAQEEESAEPRPPEPRRRRRRPLAPESSSRRGRRHGRQRRPRGLRPLRAGGGQVAAGARGVGRRSLCFCGESRQRSVRVSPGRRRHVAPLRARTREEEEEDLAAHADASRAGSRARGLRRGGAGLSLLFHGHLFAETRGRSVRRRAGAKEATTAQRLAGGRRGLERREVGPGGPDDGAGRGDGRGSAELLHGDNHRRPLPSRPRGHRPREFSHLPPRSLRLPPGALLHDQGRRLGRPRGLRPSHPRRRRRRRRFEKWRLGRRRRRRLHGQLRRHRRGGRRLSGAALRGRAPRSVGRRRRRQCSGRAVRCFFFSGRSRRRRRRRSSAVGGGVVVVADAADGAEQAAGHGGDPGGPRDGAESRDDEESGL